MRPRKQFSQNTLTRSLSATWHRDFRASCDILKVIYFATTSPCQHASILLRSRANKRSGGASVGAGYTRDPSELLHGVRTVARAEKTKATRYEANEVQIERGAPSETLEIRLDELGTAGSWVNSSRRETQRDIPAANVLETGDSSFPLEGPPEPDAPRFVVNLRRNEGTDPNWRGREMHHGKRKRIRRRFRSCGDTE